MNKLGLDIGSSKIKCVEITASVSPPKLVSYDISNLPAISLYSDSKADRSEFIDFIKEYIFSSKFSTNNIVVGLPESKVFTKIIEVPNLSEKELAESIKWEAQQYFPDSIENLSLQYQQLPRSSQSPEGEKNKTEVLLVAVNKALIEKYVGIFEKAGCEVQGIEPESMAIARAIQNAPNTPVSLALNIGADTSDLIISESGIIRFTRSVSSGMEAFTRAISQEIGIDLRQAESYLTSYGLDEGKLEGKIAKIIRPVVDMVVTEVKRSVVYFESRKQGRKVERIVLCGGGATMPGILQYIVSAVGIEVEMADPWKHLAIDSQKFSESDLNIFGPFFTTAVGLALKGL
ncbi:type IV pilus assembly protein PilM [Candidatus Parcubacteria bacterium]|nr:type IV pilus assembly protein PilM [Patescibacteria group bacterium]MBU4380912.1 type IV pilus assembly protein PilM [Patescibacteria group bacterium]MCG2688962.1 type IV pilus assembly protein PilM [Candidatus Parcubacteria bacterium]